MPVAYEYIDDILAEYGLVNPVLNILTADHQLYRTMLYQPQGALAVRVTGEKFIGNQETEAAGGKHLQFFQLAIAEGAELVMTPEYSCPIRSLSTCIIESIFPNQHHLWVLGCESIRPSQLREFIASHTTEDVIVIAEQPARDNNEDKILDPVAYLFQTIGQGGILKKVIVFQFKTFPMGAVPEEAVHLLFGTRRFVLRNNEDSIYLATIICSETQEIDLVRDLRQFVDKPYILLHPQMNRGSRTDTLKRYRTDFYNGCAEDADKDVISLNWASGSEIGEEKIEYGGSAIYTKAKKIVTTDDRIAHNDTLGLFYNCWTKAKASILVFEHSEAVYLFENCKASKRTLPVQNQGRYGPSMCQRYIWDNGWQPEEVQTNAQLTTVCAEIGGDFAPLLAPDLSSINRERLLSLSIGEIEGSSWISPVVSKLFSINNTEESNRLMVYQDPATQNSKRIWLNKYATLIQNLADGTILFPADSHMTDLTGKLDIKYQEPNLHYNVSGESDIPVCVVYKGDADPSMIEELRADLLASANQDNNFPSRLLIIYFHQGHVKKNYQKRAPSIKTPNNANPVSVTKKAS